MLTILSLLILSAGVYAAYRIIRGGFARPQSERWTGYGIVGAIVLVMLAMALAARIFG
jgi:hypothetical protein